MSNVIGNDSAPFPHLGGRAPGGQSWSSPTHTGDLFAIEFAWTASNYRRCEFRLVLLRVPAIALGALIYGVAMTLFVGIRRFLATHTVSPALFYVFVPITVTFFVVTPIFSTLILLFASPFTARMPRIIVVTSQGLCETHAKTPRVIPWSQIARVVEWDGDLYLMRRGYATGHVTPRTAFRNSDSSKRFYAALLAIWKSSGNPNAVLDEIRTEFATMSAP